MKQELPDVQAGFRKGRETRDQIANIRWIIEKKQENSRKTVYFSFIDNTKAFDCVDDKLWKILKQMLFLNSLAFSMIQQMLTI